MGAAVGASWRTGKTGTFYWSGERKGDWSSDLRMVMSEKGYMKKEWDKVAKEGWVLSGVKDAVTYGVQKHAEDRGECGEVR